MHGIFVFVQRNELSNFLHENIWFFKILVLRNIRYVLFYWHSNILRKTKYKKKKKRSVTLYKERYNIIVVFCQWNNVKDFKVKFSFLNEMLYFLFYTQNNTVIISTSTYDKILDL